VTSTLLLVRTVAAKNASKSASLMNNRTLAILAIIAVAAAVVAPVVASDRRTKPSNGSCGLLMKFDKKTKTCQSKL
jgi:hypothetical protein